MGDRLDGLYLTAWGKPLRDWNIKTSSKGISKGMSNNNLNHLITKSCFLCKRSTYGC